MPDQLIEFLRSKKKDQTSDSGIDWQAKKDDWIQSVNALYEQVEAMLDRSIGSGDVAADRVEMQITEQYVGTYSIPRLELSVGGERVEFRPMGFTTIGTAGRVDIRGQCDVITLLKGVDGGWSVVLQRVPHLKTAEFDSETLKYALERVMLPLL